jgi:hypothetical protein
MKKEFVPCEQASALKELGFKEKCFGKYYYIIEHEVYDSRKGEDRKFGDNNRIILRDTPYSHSYDENEVTVCVAPIWQQAFKWFREKYKYSYFIKEATKGKYRFHIEKFDEKYYNSEILSYEDAELGCLKKLIEIVKNK